MPRSGCSLTSCCGRRVLSTRSSQAEKVGRCLGRDLHMPSTVSPRYQCEHLAARGDSLGIYAEIPFAKDVLCMTRRGFVRTPDYARFTRLETASAQVPAEAHSTFTTDIVLFLEPRERLTLFAAVFAQAGRLLCPFLSSDCPSYTYLAASGARSCFGEPPPTPP